MRMTRKPLHGPLVPPLVFEATEERSCGCCLSVTTVATVVGRQLWPVGDEENPSALKREQQKGGGGGG